jgi:hypothetical protein
MQRREFNFLSALLTFPSTIFGHSITKLTTGFGISALHLQRLLDYGFILINNTFHYECCEA